MKESKYTCDKCGEFEISHRNPQGWFNLVYKISDYGHSYPTHIEKDLCPKCAKKLGIKMKAEVDTRNKDVGVRLIEILTEIASEVER